MTLKHVHRFARHDLTAHMRMHRGERPFPCNQCDRKFTTSGQLNQHIRKHTGENPFECKVCNKSCSSASNLKTHLLAHINAPIETQSANTNSTQTSSGKFFASTALSSHPSTFFAINEMSEASAQRDTTNQLPVDIVIDSEPSTTNDEIDEVSGENIYQAIDPSIFRIQKVRSVRHPIVKTDTNVSVSHSNH